jgi:hypothetical protein
VGIDVEEAVLEANDDVEVDGIMVYYPIYGGRQVSVKAQVSRAVLFFPSSSSSSSSSSSLHGWDTVCFAARSHLDAVPR